MEFLPMNEEILPPSDDRIFMTELEKWAVFFQYANEPTCRETVNKVIESREALQMASSLLMSVSKDERERAVFRSRRMYQTDLASDLNTSRDNGIREGMIIGKAEVARNLLAMNLLPAQIMAATGLTREEIDKLQ